MAEEDLDGRVTVKQHDENGLRLQAHRHQLTGLAGTRTLAQDLRTLGNVVSEAQCARRH